VIQNLHLNALERLLAVKSYDYFQNKTFLLCKWACYWLVEVKLLLFLVEEFL